MAYLSHMELLAHINTSGHLLQHSLKLILFLVEIPTVPVRTSIKNGLLKSLHLLETTTSVLLATLDLDLIIHMIVYSDNPLWDGEGYGLTNACCEFNNPPWFCTTLPQLTTDDLELRICHDQHASDENVLVSLVDICDIINNSVCYSVKMSWQASQSQSSLAESYSSNLLLF